MSARPWKIVTVVAAASALIAVAKKIAADRREANAS